MKISIIIPVYKTEKYLRNCLDSILAQTHKNWEAICINDGSPDNSHLILNEFKEKDPRFIVINQNNSGVSSARNKGLELATGTYVTFLDSDDEFVPNRLEKLLSIAQLDTVDLVLAGFKLISKEGTFIRNCSPFLLGLPDIHHKELTTKIIANTGTYIWNFFVKTSIIKQNTLKFNPNIALGEDLVFIMNLLPHISYISSTEEPLYYYNDRENSATSKFNSKNVPISWFTNMIDGLVEIINNINNKELKANMCGGFYMHMIMKQKMLAQMFQDKKDSKYQKISSIYKEKSFFFLKHSAKLNLFLLIGTQIKRKIKKILFHNEN